MAFFARDLRVSVYVRISVTMTAWGTGIRGLTRGMATLLQGNQELFMVKDKVGRLPLSLR